MHSCRRDFFNQVFSLSAMTAAGALGRSGLLNAMTQPAGSYRALVCVFLYGGNDSNNLVVPLDSAGYAGYKTARGALALDGATLIPFDGNKSFGLHPRFTDLQNIFPHVALVSNVGTLVQPLTRDQFLKNSAPLPGNLFSHADQQSEWQAAVPTTSSTSGWGGRLADQIASFNGGTFPALTSVAGNGLFGSGVTAHPATVTPGVAAGLAGFGADAASQARLAALETLVKQDTLKMDSGAILLRQAALVAQSGITDSNALNAALQSAKPLSTVFPNTSIGQQLLQIAKLIQIRSALNMNRQIFFCSLGGFDTHTAELNDQDRLFSQLSPALAAFYKSTETDLGVADQVTTFTESDFNRTFQPNSNGGTDHAWGSHHIVMGASVKGGKLYGKFPSLVLNGADDAGGEGRWIPTTSVDQYGATLAQWFGLQASKLSAVFPNINNFASKDVGFFG